MYNSKTKIRMLYMQTELGLEEILEVIVKDACYITRNNAELYEFWSHIEKDLEAWKNKTNIEDIRKCLKVFNRGKEDK
jgi:hypothetical protein